MMSFEHLERVYEGLTKAVDQAGPAGEALLLTKLALLLAERLGDIDAVEACIAAALEADTSRPRDPDDGGCCGTDHRHIERICAACKTP